MPPANSFTGMEVLSVARISKGERMLAWLSPGVPWCTDELWRRSRW